MTKEKEIFIQSTYSTKTVCMLGFYHKHLEEMSDVEMKNYFWIKNHKTEPRSIKYVNSNYGDREIIEARKERDGNYTIMLLDHIRTKEIKEYKPNITVRKEQ